LIFLISRIRVRQVNPPYSFIFIFIGLSLWFLSAMLSAFIDREVFNHLDYEGSVASIILSVGSRLIPGILGHVEIVATQRKAYENQRPFMLTVPWHFSALVLGFVISYFFDFPLGESLRAMVVLVIS